MTDGRDNLLSLKMVLAAERSAEVGQPVALESL